jgi:hypothetical protein
MASQARAPTATLLEPNSGIPLGLNQRSESSFGWAASSATSNARVFVVPPGTPAIMPLTTRDLIFVARSAGIVYSLDPQREL